MYINISTTFMELICQNFICLCRRFTAFDDLLMNCLISKMIKLTKDFSSSSVLSHVWFKVWPGSRSRSIFSCYLHTKQHKNGNAAGYGMLGGNWKFSKSRSLLEYNSSELCEKNNYNFIFGWQAFRVIIFFLWHSLGIIRIDSTCTERPWRVSLFLPHCYARFGP